MGLLYLRRVMSHRQFNKKCGKITLSYSGTKHKEEKIFKINAKEKQYDGVELTGKV